MMTTTTTSRKEEEEEDKDERWHQLPSTVYYGCIFMSNVATTKVGVAASLRSRWALYARNKILQLVFLADWSSFSTLVNWRIWIQRSRKEGKHCDQTRSYTLSIIVRFFYTRMPTYICYHSRINITHDILSWFAYGVSRVSTDGAYFSRIISSFVFFGRVPCGSVISLSFNRRMIFAGLPATTQYSGTSWEDN